MIAGVRGRLLTASFIRDVFPTMNGVGAPPPSWGRRVADWSKRVESALGTASSIRAITDVALLPIADLLCLTPVQRTDTSDVSYLQLSAGDCTIAAVTTRWGESLDRLWRSSVIGAIASDTRWCLCCNGQTLRLIDARRTWSRDYLEFELALLALQPEAQAVLWSVASAAAFSGTPSPLDTAVILSRQHGTSVCRALGQGVLQALEALLGALTRGRKQTAAALWEQSLTVLYRVLFLLFAEARGLVPLWHPIYRDRYSLEAIVAVLLAGRPYKGLWRAVHAISRLAHAGCTAGELRVTAFNGRLFAPSQAVAFDSTRISDAVMSQAVVALSSTPVGRPGTRSKILYRDLDVEQLGAVYERVLEYEPTSTDAAPLARTRDIRKSSGSFYTPRAVTTFLVRQTLEPLARGRTADEILSLRVLDPAMGSGAFLVATCRYLASAVEDALIREGRWHSHDITPSDRVALRREIASRCLFGVDVNPMAVQLARLSLWLATLAADKPLSFLDHHLVSGDSLVGATPADVSRQPGGPGSRKRQERLSLFEDTELSTALDHAAQVIARLSNEPDDSPDIVRRKERALHGLQSDDSALTKWKAVLDLWCGAWFWDDDTTPGRGVFQDLVARLLDRPSTLQRHLSTTFLDRSATIAALRRFLHWTLTFPDVFAAMPGRPAGFDAIVGNPPWDMVRGDSGADETRAGRRVHAQHVTDFVRQSGIYRVEARAHLNLYQLFVERALQLVRPGGRIGFVLPSGIVSDAGAAPVRRYLFDHADVDQVTGFDNRLAIFPVHRSVRFVLMTCTTGSITSSIRCRFGLTSADQLEPGGKAPLVLSRRLLGRLSGDDDLGVPELATEMDLAIVEAVSASTPRLGATDGWSVTFGRELNASDDKGLFAPIAPDSSGRPVVEGKQLEPFRVDVTRSRLEVPPSASAQLRVPRRARLAYRDVASATNRLTLIAAIVPARAVTTHTLFCLRTPLALHSQRVLCALLNSYVANYLIRLRVNTHVTVSLVSRLPVPVISSQHPLFARLAECSEVLSAAKTPAEGMEEYADIQALAARLYGLTSAQFEHVLTTFPLVPAAVREGVFRRFIDLH
jgi:hypothetical protein